MLIKFCKFIIVGGTGAIITFGITWILTEKLGLWYMASLAIATIIAMTSNFLFNNYWTFAVKQRTPDDADYEWFAFYNGNPIQKWWKQSIAKTIWQWIPNSSMLLDIGCGSSPIIGKYANAYAIDRNKEKLEFLKHKFPSIDATYGDIENIYYEPESFDYVLCVEVVEHLKNPEKVIGQIAKVLKQGGHAVIATPDYSKLLWRIAEKFTPYNNDHVFRFNRHKLESMCLAHGLKPIKYKYIAKCDLCEMFERI